MNPSAPAPHELIAPCIALAALTMAVCAVGFRRRVQEMRRCRIHPQQLATSAQRQQHLHDTVALDNLANLFELPVLFYVCCLSVALCGLHSAWLLGLAWVYVFLRSAHSFIHLGHNKVMLRFYAWGASNICLAAMWLIFSALYFLA